MANKAELRKHFLARRREIASEDKHEWDALIFHSLTSFEPIVAAGSVMTYLSHKNEVDTFRLVRYLLQSGKRVAVPRTNILNIQIIPSEIKDIEAELHPGAFGIPEPRPGCFRLINAAEIDVHIIPGIVFDMSGQRIGYSRGFYDRFLSTVPPTAHRIGLCYECQLADHVPSDEWDVPVHTVITENRVIHCRDI